MSWKSSFISVIQLITSVIHTLWTASLVMNVCVLLSLWRVSMIVFWTTVRSAVFPMIVSPSEPNWDHFEDSGNLCRCFELISWLACHHILICWEWIGGFLTPTRYLQSVPNKVTSECILNNVIECCKCELHVGIYKHTTYNIYNIANYNS